MEQMTVSQLARRTGTPPDTIRYYTRIGLLPEPPRSAAGYRLFDRDAEDRVTFVKRGQRLGLRLEEIEQLLRVRDEGGCPCGSTRGMLEHRLGELDEELAALTALREEVSALLAHLPEDPPSDGWRCPSQLAQISEPPEAVRRGIHQRR